MTDPRVVRTDLVDGVAYPPARTGLQAHRAVHELLDDA